MAIATLADALKPAGVDLDCGGATEQCTLMWGALTMDSGCGVFILDAEGQILYSNDLAADRFGLDSDGPAGRLHDVLPERVADEQLDMIRLALDHGGPIQIQGMLRGVFSLTSYRQVPGAEDKIIAVTRPCQSLRAASTRGGPRVMRARFDDHGELDKLTNREVEVLRLIGLGRSTAAIAEELHRSVKTIEWHRVSLGNKLGVTNRVELARIAINAGLAALDEPHAGAKAVMPPEKKK